MKKTNKQSYDASGLMLSVVFSTITAICMRVIYLHAEWYVALPLSLVLMLQLKETLSAVEAAVKGANARQKEEENED